MSKPNAVHLGDGAYITFTGYSFILTANHHLPEKATDTVHIDAQGMVNLLAFADRIEKECQALREAGQ